MDGYAPPEKDSIGHARDQVLHQNWNHAWNIVKLNGKYYPIDLTWDSTCFRAGRSNTYDFLGQDVEYFKQRHIVVPGWEDYGKIELSAFDPEEIKKLRLRLEIEKDYKTTTYVGTRKDGSKYLISQVGDINVGGKPVYRYYYAEVLKNGKLSDQAVVYSHSNVSRLIHEKAVGRNIPDGYEEAIDNVLFSRENIRDSIAKGTCYIGHVTKNINGNKYEFVKRVSEIPKSKECMEIFRFPTREFTRDDGTSFVVQKMREGIMIEGASLNQYHIFECVMENGHKVVKRNVVYSEGDLITDKRWGIPNDFLRRDRLDRKVGEAGGYIGHYRQDNRREYNPKISQFFKSDIHRRNIRLSDLGRSVALARSGRQIR